MVLRRLYTVVGILILGMALLGGLQLVTSSTPAGDISGTLGRQLLLVSPPSGQVQLLATLPVTVHVQIALTNTTGFIASAQPAAYASVRASGADALLLDSDTRNKVYYFLDAQAKNAHLLADRWGTTVYSDDRQILLAIPAARERSFLDAVAQNPIHIELLTGKPLYLGERAGTTVPKTVTGEANAAVASLLSLVTPDRLSAIIADLSGNRPVSINGRTLTLFTRYTFSKQIGDATSYVRQALARLGLSPQDVPWSYGRYSGVNIIADIRGCSNPDRIWLIGGHVDDTSQTPYTRAPGADDNASGIASMLVIADILRQHQFQDTIRFVAFSGEEQGMWGSKSYAGRLAASGAQIAGYIDLDMIGWDGDNDHRVELHSGTRQSSIVLANAFAAANARYGSGLIIEIKQGTASRFSDHSSFWDVGYPAILAIEDFFADGRTADRNPRYHNSGDLLANVRLDYVTRYTQAALATIAELAGLTDTQTATPTPTSTASLQATPTARPPSPSTATATLTPTPAGGTGTCRDLMANGNMEAAFGWTFGRTARPASYTDAAVFAGNHGLRTGIEPWTLDRRSHSSAYQSVAIPQDAASALLTAQIRRGTGDGTGDYQEILLLTPGYRLVRTLYRGLANDADWQTVRYDLTSLAGQTVVVYFNVYNDGDGRRTWMYADDVHLSVCIP